MFLLLKMDSTELHQLQLDSPLLSLHFTTSQGLFGQEAQGVTFSAVGNKTYTLTNGKDYSGTDNAGMSASLGDVLLDMICLLIRTKLKLDFLLMGPGCTTEAESQAKANKLISIAE